MKPVMTKAELLKMLEPFEVSTDEQKKAIYQIAGRTAFPLTMGFWKNELKFVKLGQLFGDDLSSALKFKEDQEQRRVLPVRNREV